MKNALPWGKGDVEERVGNWKACTALALQNLVDTEGHDTVGSFGLSLSSYRGVWYRRVASTVDNSSKTL